MILLCQKNIPPLHVHRDEEEGLLVDTPRLGDHDLHRPVVGKLVQVGRDQIREQSGHQRPEVIRPQQRETGLEHQRGVGPGDVRHSLR